jgi:hypothetical protein
MGYSPRLIAHSPWLAAHSYLTVLSLILILLPINPTTRSSFPEVYLSAPHARWQAREGAPCVPWQS